MNVRSYMIDNTLNYLGTIKAKLAADILSHKEKLGDEASRLWEPIWTNCGSWLYFERIQRELWNLNAEDIQKVYDSAISFCDNRIKTIIIFGQKEGKIPFFEPTDIELPLLGLYQHIGDLKGILGSSMHDSQINDDECHNIPSSDVIMIERLINAILTEFQD